MRFLAYNQYVHKMLHRWGPNVKEMMAIKKYLATQSISFSHPPWVRYIWNTVKLLHFSENVTYFYNTVYHSND
jgi:hypothetical protein